MAELMVAEEEAVGLVVKVLGSCNCHLVEVAC